METRGTSARAAKTKQTPLTAPCLVRRELQQTIYHTALQRLKARYGRMGRRKERREFLQRTSDLRPPGTCIGDPLDQPAQHREDVVGIGAFFTCKTSVPDNACSQSDCVLGVQRKRGEFLVARYASSNRR